MVQLSRSKCLACALSLGWFLAGCAAEPEPGLDAGAHDAGPVPDAGGDAGTDAGATDDAGLPDAGPFDAGNDSGVADAGRPDAGNDAGTACGALAQPCCAGTCNAGSVCSGLTCVPPISSHTCPGGAPGALFVSEVPPPSTIAPWEVFFASVTFANCGTQTWTATAAGAPTGHKLGFDSPRDYDTWGTSRVALPADVPPGSKVTVPLRARAGALTGAHGWAWSVLHEGVAWLPEASPSRTVNVAATSALVTLCPGVQADIGGVASASAQVQQCIDAAPAGGTVLLPAGIYRVTSELQLSKPLTLGTAGTQALTAGCLDPDGPRCAVFRADANLSVPRGFLRLGATTAVVLDHLVLDGNRGQRLTSAAAGQCAAGNNGAGFNASTGGCTGCSFLRSGSARALCGTGFEWRGDQATVTGSVFRENGAHTVTNMWSDGLTLLQSDGARVTASRFVDNSDVDLIFGGGTNATVQNNRISHFAQATFAGLMLDNFNGSTSGDFTGTVVSGNSIECGALLCDFAIELGPHAWYQSANIIGGTVSGNSATGGKFGINVEGGGTVAQPMVVTGNTLGPSPSSATFLCGARACTAFNVSPDSHVDVQTGPAPTGAFQFHDCP
ncbi:MAG: right-handed parallel beta-helix repeat-containing protein [Myxococcaceae bacterium]